MLNMGGFYTNIEMKVQELFEPENPPMDKPMPINTAEILLHDLKAINYQRNTYNQPMCTDTKQALKEPPDFGYHGIGPSPNKSKPRISRVEDRSDIGRK